MLTDCELEAVLKVIKEITVDMNVEGCLYHFLIVLQETNIVETQDPDADPETPHNADYCCPLCCDGQMTKNVDSPVEEQQDEEDDEVIGDFSDSENSIQDLLMSSVDSKLNEGNEPVHQLSYLNSISDLRTVICRLKYKFGPLTLIFILLNLG